MALNTRHNLIELIRRDLSGGFPSDMDRVRDAEIAMQINSIANALLKKEYFNTTLNIEGDRIPDGCMLATYTIDVTPSENYTATATLPIVPVVLPKGMGVFSVYPYGRPDLAYIPVPPNVVFQVQKDKMISPIGKKCYSVNGKRVVIYDNLIGAGVTKLNVQLAVMDIETLDDNDVLPIPADMISEIHTVVVEIYKGEQHLRRNESNQPQP